MEQTRLVRRLLAMGQGGRAPGLVLELVGGGVGGAVCRNQIHRESLFCCPENQVHCNINFIVM